MDSLEFTAWLAYFRVIDTTPTPADVRADWRHAEVMTVLANAYRNTKRRPEPFRHEEFVPRWNDAPQPDATPSDDEVRAAVEQLNAAFGGRMVN